MSLRPAPITLRLANAYVEAVHRHNVDQSRAKYAVAVIDGTGLLRGVGIAGTPKARMLATAPGEHTVEILRVCTDGARNACSLLYGACARAAAAMGYTLAVTYTLTSEPGTSLRAAGFELVADTRSQGWDRRGRSRGVQGYVGPDVSRQPGHRWQRRVGAPGVPTMLLPEVLRPVDQLTLFDGAA